MVLGLPELGEHVQRQLGMVAPPAGIGKMPKQFNSSVDRHHEVIAIFNELMVGFDAYKARISPGKRSSQ